MDKKTFLKKHWYLTVMAVLSIINGLLRAFVNFDFTALIWIAFAIFWIYLLHYFYDKEK
ncbi:hypothetical protein [Streptococcus loxodontisalivarius]|uniref:Uncharacterized protein n=1 Tax=Streptococcus loxodontisalivarius TaxID=1349415 RepID=A0ABS2PU11_9STRE|nr:hypothetical protein [Streptococcus loxodontisalivarius]MBM7643532.1 hypothetical protein [Streptococcus loxodontisalivarius]